MAKQFTNENFDQTISTSKAVMVDFFTQWCGPCKSMSPMVEKLAAEYEGKIVVGKVDADESGEIAQRFMIRGVPTFLFFKDGQQVDKHVGIMSESEMRSKLNALL